MKNNIKSQKINKNKKLNFQYLNKKRKSKEKLKKIKKIKKIKKN
jgi:hypothetical protein